MTKIDGCNTIKPEFRMDEKSCFIRGMTVTGAQATIVIANQFFLSKALPTLTLFCREFLSAKSVSLLSFGGATAFSGSLCIGIYRLYTPPKNSQLSTAAFLLDLSIQVFGVLLWAQKISNPVFWTAATFSILTNAFIYAAGASLSDKPTKQPEPWTQGY